MFPLGCRPRLLLGEVVITKQASAVISNEDVQGALRRVTHGDWGEIRGDDVTQNEKALQDGGCLLAVFRSANGTAFWVITEIKLSVTTVILPEEY